MADEHEIYVVERHDDHYYGPHKQRFAESLETALEMAEHQRDEHRGDEWRLNTESGGDEDVTFHATDERGWVAIKKAPLHP